MRVCVYLYAFVSPSMRAFFIGRATCPEAGESEFTIVKELCVARIANEDIYVEVNESILWHEENMQQVEKKTKKKK